MKTYPVAILLSFIAGTCQPAIKEELPPCEDTARCGDGIVDGALDEICDDGNNRGGDGCRADCLGVEKCGDGLVDFGEECDLTNPQDPRCIDCVIQ